jgi:hypothetical protein
VNPENRNQVIIFVVLIAVLAVVLYMFVLQPAGDPAGAATVGVPGAQGEAGAAYQNIQTAFIEDAVDVDSLLAKIEDVRFDYSESHENRNPMKPLVGTNPELAADGLAGMGNEEGTFSDDQLLFYANALAFTGVVFDQVVPLAIIDNQLTYIGYQFDDVDGLISVKQINQDNVVLEVRLEEGPIEHVQRLKEPEAL